MTTVTVDPSHGSVQRVRIDAQALRREVKEQGFTFDGIDDYLRKYHGFKHFALKDASRLGSEIIVDIRHIGWWERFKNRVRGM